VTDLTPLRGVAVGRLLLVDLSVELDVKFRELSRRRPPENLEMLGLSAALVHGYRRGGILRGVGQMFTVAITGVCRAVQV
jgi:hypothetical protein